MFPHVPANPDQSYFRNTGCVWENHLQKLLAKRRVLHHLPENKIIGNAKRFPVLIRDYFNSPYLSVFMSVLYFNRAYPATLSFAFASF